MIKDKLKETQPIVYKALENACKGRLAPAYLFYGPIGTPKYDAAIFLAESILCKESDMACETCDTCLRVSNGEYGDMIILDGSEGSISKKDVDELQERFSKTAIEEGNGERIYIIRNVENMTIAAQNSMLKFLEDPKENIIAILTTDNTQRILPTIISRCISIPFIQESQEKFYEEIISLGVEEDDAYFLSNIARDSEDILETKESDEYTRAISMFKQFLSLDGLDRSELLIDYDISWSFNKNEKAKNIKLLKMFFGLIAMYAKNVLENDDKGPSWYHVVVKNASKSNGYYAKILKIAIEARDKVNKFNDLNLLLAEALYRLEELDRDKS